ncbi:M23 family metallopeptidase [Plebeiibacterium marinum]|uniref:M23 family metallopeptidase n=1 Tax=Plebeiibacterium marinum TaxID=2992111 RepID=A0AAE3MI32_9BACT|nr:M23 family metallopeptidase [Plebeiobacterium marinum]MCW3807871.1 M23 family metallopeptidase [Plebeiobacterium marinum]
MDNSKEKKNFIQKLRNKYRLAIFNEQTYEEVWAMRLSRLNVFTVVGASAVVLVVLVSLLIAYTGLREYIPGFPDGNERIMMVRNVNRVDSLIQEIKKRDEFFESIKAVVQGEVPAYEDMDSDNKSGKNVEHVSFESSKEDQEFREKVEKEEKYNLSVLDVKDRIPELNQAYFYTPLKGYVVKKFVEGENHFGVDIVSKPGETVLSILNGTVIFSGWTVETGYVLMIQHGNDIISVYKHNSKLLKKSGERIEAGEAIANVGNSGELTTGPHLHFELWYQGQAVDPEEYILFE